MDRILLRTRLLTSVLLLVFPFIGQALEKEVYRVEVVVFEHLDKNASQEALPIYTGRPNSNGAVDWGNLSENPSGNSVRHLPLKEQSLTDTVSKLKQNRGYRVLLHEGWEQPLNPTRKIALFKEADPWSMQGIIELKQRRALFLTTDILLERGSNKRSLFFGGGNEGIMGYRIEDSRPIRLKELEYIDHPNFGILVQVLKVKRGSDKVIPKEDQAPKPEEVLPEEPTVTEIGV